MKKHNAIYWISFWLAWLGVLVNPTITLAQGPEPITVSLDGYLVLGDPPIAQNFTVPMGYEMVGKLVGSKKEGHPELGCLPGPDPNDREHRYCDQAQPNEEIRILLNGEVCLEHFDQNPLDDQWFDFATTCSVQPGQNILSVAHTGKGVDPGSVHFELTFTLNPAPKPQCTNVIANKQVIYPGEEIEVTIIGDNATAYCVVQNGDIQAEEPNPSLTFQANPNLLYEAAVRNDHYDWQFSEACQFTLQPTVGSVAVTKRNPQGEPWSGVTIDLLQAGQLLATTETDARGIAVFENLAWGDYVVQEIVPENTFPIGPTRYAFTVGEAQLDFAFEFINEYSPPPACNSVIYQAAIPPEGEWVEVTIQATNANEYCVMSGNTIMAEGPSPVLGFFARPNTQYEAAVKNNHYNWLFSPECQFTIPKVEIKTGAIQVAKVDENEQPWSGDPIPVELWASDRLIATDTIDGGETITFGDLPYGDYTIREIPPKNALPIGPTTYQVTLNDNQPTVAFAFQNKMVYEYNLTVEIGCQNVTFTGYAEKPVILSCALSDGQNENHWVEGTFSETMAWTPAIEGQYGPHNIWALAELFTDGETKARVEARENLTCGPVHCELIEPKYTPIAVDEAGNPVPITAFKAESNFGFTCPATPPNQLPFNITWPNQKDKHYWVQFSVEVANNWYGGSACRIEHETQPVQYQSFIGPVAFGNSAPILEAGKEYFDGPRSVMYNLEYPQPDGTCDLVLRQNGAEISDVTSSCFNNGTFQQVTSLNGRATMTLAPEVTKMIAYRYGVEEGRIFQTNNGPNTRWIHPLDQPFEHKPEFALELHGPPNTTDLLLYHNYETTITYGQDGVTIIDLIFDRPGIVAIYPLDEVNTIAGWTTVDAFAVDEPITYAFAETGLYHYQIVDEHGLVLAGPSPHSVLSLEAMPAMRCYAQVAYPATSLYISLVGDMKIDHPGYWRMPVDPEHEAEHEFHIDYHRDANGDLVIEAMYLLNATASIAQQFPYGRHDGMLPGLNLVGIPNVSMVAFCSRPGYHEVAWWGGWENESYYLPKRSYAVSPQANHIWGFEQQADCIDAARRVNMELARQGLRTDHTYAHHGERSQGYQMMQHNIWSPYNLVDLRPPHIGTFLKPGTVLPYYHNAEDMLFWGWDLDKGGLADGIGEAELKQYMLSLGPVEYIDHTGIHPPEGFNR